MNIIKQILMAIIVLPNLYWRLSDGFLKIFRFDFIIDRISKQFNISIKKNGIITRMKVLVNDDIKLIVADPLQYCLYL